MVSHMTKTERMALNRAYVKSHRDEWRKHGFVQATVVLHEDDKNEVQAYAEIVKYERMLTGVLAESKSVVQFAAGRNMGRCMTEENARRIMSVADQLVIDVVRRKRVATLLDTALDFAEARDKALASIDLTAAPFKRMYLAALAVCYSNLSASTGKLAEVLVDTHDRIDSPSLKPIDTLSEDVQ